MVKTLRLVSFVVLFSFSVLSPKVVVAVPIINIGKVSPNPGGFIVYDKGEFATLNSYGKSASQPVSIDFDGDLSGIGDILSGGRLFLDDILASGKANLTNGIVEQKTQGGTLKLYSGADDSSLLLSGTIRAGVLSGGLGQNESASFQTWEFNATGGSLKANYWDKMVDLRIDFGNLDDCIIISKRCFISSLGPPKGPVAGSILLDDYGNLQSFRAGITDGFVNAKGGTPPQPPTDVPEPATALLMIFGGALYPLRKKMIKH